MVCNSNFSVPNKDLLDHNHAYVFTDLLYQILC